MNIKAIEEKIEQWQKMQLDLSIVIAVEFNHSPKMKLKVKELTDAFAERAISDLKEIRDEEIKRRESTDEYNYYWKGASRT